MEKKIMPIYIFLRKCFVTLINLWVITFSTGMSGFISENLITLTKCNRLNPKSLMCSKSATVLDRINNLNSCDSNSQ